MNNATILPPPHSYDFSKISVRGLVSMRHEAKRYIALPYFYDAPSYMADLSLIEKELRTRGIEV